MLLQSHSAAHLYCLTGVPTLHTQQQSFHLSDNYTNKHTHTQTVNWPHVLLSTQKTRRLSAGTNQGLTECRIGICHWTAKVVSLTKGLFITDVSKETTALFSKPKDVTCPNHFTLCSHINGSEQCSKPSCNRIAQSMQYPGYQLHAFPFPTHEENLLFSKTPRQPPKLTH